MALPPYSYDYDAYRVPYQFDFSNPLWADVDEIDLTTDPVTNTTLGPPNYIEIIMADPGATDGVLIFKCKADPDNWRTFSRLRDGAPYDGSIALTTIKKDGTTVAGLHVRW